MKAPIRKRGPAKICYDCEYELYPNGKIIFDDPLEKQDSEGKWYCSDCQLTDRRKSLLNHMNTLSQEQVYGVNRYPLFLIVRFYKTFSLQRG
jgi:hypothetical protein